MKIRNSHIVLVVMCAIAALFLVAYQRTRPPAPQGEEDFLATVRDSAGARASGGPQAGMVPPVPTDLTNAPSIELDLPRDSATMMPHLDMGLLPNDRVTRQSVLLRNTGKSELRIRSVQTDCPCPYGVVEQTAIPPGGETNLIVVLEPDKVGGFSKSNELTVVSNDPRRPTMKVLVTCEVEPEFSIEPTRLDFGSFPGSDPPEKVVTLKQVGDVPFEVVDVTTPTQDSPLDFEVRARPEDLWDAPGKAEYEVVVRIAEDAPAGPFGTSAHIKTNIARLPMYPVVIRGQVEAFYQVTNPTGMFGSISPGQTLEGVQRLTADRPFVITEVSTDLDGLSVEAVPANAEQTEWRFDMTCAERTSMGRRMGHVEFVLSDPDGKTHRDRFPMMGMTMRADNAVPGEPPA